MIVIQMKHSRGSLTNITKAPPTLPKMGMFPKSYSMTPPKLRTATSMHHMRRIWTARPILPLTHLCFYLLASSDHVMRGGT